VARKKELCPSGRCWCGHESLTGRGWGHSTSDELMEEAAKEGHRHMEEMAEMSERQQKGGQ